MKYRTIALSILLACCASLGWGSPKQSEDQIQELTASNLPAFLARFRRDVRQTDLDLGQLSDAKLPLLDEAGHALGRRRVTDRRQTLIDLRKTLDNFESNPRNLVAAMTLSDQAEELADEVYDLSQIAYDNDREELALELTGVLKGLNHEADLLQAYSLDLAAQKEQELRRLHKKG